MNHEAMLTPFPAPDILGVTEGVSDARVLVHTFPALLGPHGLGLAQLGRRLVEGFHNNTVRPAGEEVKRRQRHARPEFEASAPRVTGRRSAAEQAFMRVQRPCRISRIRFLLATI
jgi:hypothetical protein